MSWAYKALAVLVAVGASFCAGYFTRGEVTVTKTQIQEVEVEKIVTKVVTEKVKAPDGTITTKETKTTTADSTTKTKSKQAEKSVAPVAAAYRTTYSLGVNWQPRIDPEAWTPTGIELGYRVLGNAWATGGYDWRDRSLTVGVRLEF